MHLHLTVNTLRLHYKDQPVTSAEENDHRELRTIWNTQIHRAGKM